MRWQEPCRERGWSCVRNLIYLSGRAPLCSIFPCHKMTTFPDWQSHMTEFLAKGLLFVCQEPVTLGLNDQCDDWREWKWLKYRKNLSKVKPSCSRAKKIQVKKPTQSCYQQEGFRPRQPEGSHKIDKVQWKWKRSYDERKLRCGSTG